MIVAYHAA